MNQLLGPDGKPISSATYNKKAPAPALGEKYGNWGGPDLNIMALPGGGALQFDLNALTLADYSQMKDHYQINSSLTLLMFLMHQIEWRIICDDKKQADFYTEQLANNWTPLVRSKSQANWAGYSPNVLQWDNDVDGRRIVLTKIKDIQPELAEVKWKVVDGAGTNKLNVYDGIKPLFNSAPIPVENTYWYPLLMDHGNYYGRKLLRSAFQPWFFSILVHLFANRYYERFGEPTPVGRAPYEDEVRFGGKEMRGNEAMEMILTQLRNRSAVVLPNEKTQFGDETTLDYDYQIEYLESQMRGADFERYMTRLDEEMSLALFTPILMMRTADVGSYNLGTQHSKIYLWMLNALAGDWKYYIDWYLLKPLRDYNFGTNAPMPQISFRRQGAANEELVSNVLSAVVAKGTAEPDYELLGEAAGIPLKKVRQLKQPATDPNAPAPNDPNAPSQDPSQGNSTGAPNKANAGNVRAVVELLSERIEDQVVNAFRRDDLSSTQFSLGFQRKFEEALSRAGVTAAHTETRNFFASVDALLRDMVTMNYSNPETFMLAFRGNMNWRVDQIWNNAAA